MKGLLNFGIINELVVEKLQHRCLSVGTVIPETKNANFSNKDSIQSITGRERQSNIEILRILAMFLVLIVHADFWSLGGPTYLDFTANPLNAITRTVIESISIVCVNVFILISGWFGIRPSKKGFLNFLFQCAFFLFGIYGVLLLLGKVDLSLKGVAGCFCLTSANWFIRAYVGLYILSPVLNYFIENVQKKQYRNILIFFFVFQTIYGWSGAARFVEMGYSTFSFIGLYLLAQYTKRYCLPEISKYAGRLYIGSIVINSFGYFLLQKVGLPIDVYAYINPIVIIASLGLLVFFNNLTVNTNKIINWIAKSAFAAFLLHSNPNIGVPVFKAYVNKIYSEFDGIECLFVILFFLIFVFSSAIVIDSLRRWIWKKISVHIV